MKPKVLVGCPTYQGREYCFNQYINAIKKLTYSNYDILLVDNSENDNYYRVIKEKGINVIKDKYEEGAYERIVNSRNILRDKVLSGGYDYFLSLEQDVIPPLDVIERLMKHNKPIVSGVYYNFFKKPDGKLILQPLIYKELTDKEKERLSEFDDVNVNGQIKRQCFIEEMGGNYLMNIKACGLGCVLISKEVLKKIKFRYDYNHSCFDDMFFCGDADLNGFDIYVDTSVKCKHLVLGRKKEDSWTELKR